MDKRTISFISRRVSEGGDRIAHGLICGHGMDRDFALTLYSGCYEDIRAHIANCCSAIRDKQAYVFTQFGIVSSKVADHKGVKLEAAGVEPDRTL
jgi:hypothetical protein